ncbi:hypothetical protein ACIQGT_13705 [Streptomyces sp. NPDC093108]|uniref:hypothetical protein n=1 Tax=unclassified Streptomyces TaxID=2593676 RepID=UPI00381D15D2
MSDLPTDWVRVGLTEPEYTPADPQSGRALVDYHLRELGLGETRYVRTGNDGLRYGRHETPVDIGVCRAEVLTEAAWPQGAELCVIVRWSPDAALRRDAAAEEHWRDRIAATAHALEGIGYVVEPSRFSSPRFHSAAELLVYRMASGVPPREAPADSEWALSSPVPPHHQQSSWTWREKSPQDLVHEALERGGLRRPDASFGRVAVRSITQTVWPPEADRCAWVIWWPAVDYTRAETGVLPAGAEGHWSESLGRLHRVLGEAGLVVRSRARRWHPEDTAAEFLVYRVASAP